MNQHKDCMNFDYPSSWCMLKDKQDPACDQFKPKGGDNIPYPGQGFPQGFGLGPTGQCVCPSCGYSQPHGRMQPCSQLLCPNCGVRLIRK